MCKCARVCYVRVFYECVCVGGVGGGVHVKHEARLCLSSSELFALLPHLRRCLERCTPRVQALIRKVDGRGAAAVCVVFVFVPSNVSRRMQALGCTCTANKQPSSGTQRALANSLRELSVVAHARL